MFVPNTHEVSRSARAAEQDCQAAQNTLKDDCSERGDGEPAHPGAAFAEPRPKGENNGKEAYE